MAKIKVTRAFFYKGVVQPVGKVLEYPEHLAVEAVHMNKAERVGDASRVEAPAAVKAKDKE